jgi:hypothetical protein
MNSPESSGGSSGVRFDEQVACSLCGRYGAFGIGGQFLCPDCYESCGSCCPEFGREDLEERAAAGVDSAAPGNSGPVA